MRIVGFRAGWGLGNALFIATALSTIVVSARGSTAQAVILFEAALGLGHRRRAATSAAQLGSIAGAAPFFGVAVLMSVALVATDVPAAAHAARRCGVRRWPTRSAPCATPAC